MAAKRRMRFCPDCDEGITYGKEQRCRACRALRNRVRNRLAYRSAHGVTGLCLDCKQPHGRHGTKKRCKPCDRIYQRARLNAWRAANAAARERNRIYMKAYRVYGPGEAARRLLEEWLESSQVGDAGRAQESKGAAG